MIGLGGGFGHCVGMCHPFVLYLASHDQNVKKQGFFRQILPHLGYNCGRIITYISLGVLFGIIGKITGDLVRIQGVAAMVAGALLVIYGSCGLLGVNVLNLVESQGLLRHILYGLRAIEPRNGLVMGIALGFLPCGQLYGVLAGSLALSHPLAGGLGIWVFSVLAPPLP